MRAGIAAAVALAGFTGLIGGCDMGPSENERLIALAKADVAKEFKDPDSVNFRNMQVEKNPPTSGVMYVCGEINAKNGFGAYVGYEKFYSRLEGQGSNITAKYSVLQETAVEQGSWFYPSGCSR